MTSSPIIHTIAVIYNPDKLHAKDVAARTAQLIEAAGRKVHVIRDDREGPAGREADRKRSERIGDADAVIVLGGDGTFLGVARAVALRPRPILGINLGYFGFLTELTPDGLDEAVACLLEGRFRLVQRSLLDVVIRRQMEQESVEVFRSIAVNEALIMRTATGRLLHLRLTNDERTFLAYKADGLIVATPTGSTGHSLSAGGPILEPDLEAIIITPVCPHSLLNRPLVFKGEEALHLHFMPGGDEVVLSIDGQIRQTCSREDTVVIRRAHTLPSIALPGRSFAQILQLKFGIGDITDWRH